MGSVWKAHTGEQGEKERTGAQGAQGEEDEQDEVEPGARGPGARSVEERGGATLGQKRGWRDEGRGSRVECVGNMYTAGTSKSPGWRTPHKISKHGLTARSRTSGHAGASEGVVAQSKGVVIDVCARGWRGTF